MKQLFENWRKFISEELASFARGGDYKRFVDQNPEATIEVFQRMGADERILSIISKYTENTHGFNHLGQNQIIAVLAGAKPMYYGEIHILTEWSEMDQDCYDSLPQSTEPTVVLQEQECPDVEIGEFILNNLDKIGLTYEPVFGARELIVLGKPENVAAVVKEVNRIGNSFDGMDKQFHKVLGLALGYPEEDVEKFINDPRAPTPGAHRK